MARKRRIFSIRVQSQTILKRALIRSRRILIFILCGLWGLSSAWLIPAFSHDIRSLSDKNQQEIQIEQINNTILLAQADRKSNPDILAIAQEGQKRYDAGQFSEAISLWQQAAEAYEKIGDEAGLFKSLINQAQALQNIGSYPRACKTLLQAFSVNVSSTKPKKYNFSSLDGSSTSLKPSFFRKKIITPNSELRTPNSGSVSQPNCNSEQIEFLLNKFSENPNSLSLDRAIGLRSLGDVLRRQGQLAESQKALEISLSKAKGSSAEGATQLSLGNTARTLGRQTRNRWNYEQVTEMIASQSQLAALEPEQPAIESYNQVVTLSSTPAITKVQAQLNYLSLLLDIRRWWTEQVDRRIASWSRINDVKLIQRAEGFLSLLDRELTKEISVLQTQIESNLDNLSLSRPAVYARVNLAHNYLQIPQINNVESILKTALEQARTLNYQEAESYALGYLGQTYDRQWQQFDRETQQSFAGKALLARATKLTQQALLLAGDAAEMSYLWQSQLGNLLKEQGDVKGAISAYMAAFNTLQSLRTDLNKNNQDLQFDFRQEIEPVYKSLADLLLKTDLSEQELESLVVLNPQTTQRQSKIQPQTNRLELAQTIIESLQLAELDNFFQDPCIEETDFAVKIDDLDNQAAVIYPIIFVDRLEVLLSLPKQPLQQITISISEREFNQTLDRLYDNLYNESIDNSAVNIFRTVPLNAKEVEDNTQKLRSSLTQLYQWLIEPFESELNSNQIETLVFVLNDRLQRIPMAALYDGEKYLIENYGVALVPSLQLKSISSPQLKQEPLNILAAGVSQQIEFGGKIFPALNKVPQELNQIEANCPNCQKLLNEEFTAERLESELKKQSYNVVHLATHGLFSSNPEKTFIITGNGESINIDKLSELLSVEKTNIPELLVLSACNTATGDERAILGLAGVAVRSGTSSTIASLWPVGDEFTANLMEQFYQEFRKPNINKVTALKDAQLSLITFLKNNPRSRQTQNLISHPYYWAPYVLVGNWQ